VLDGAGLIHVADTLLFAVLAREGPGS
jgi:hypothetical protein